MYASDTNYSIPARYICYTTRCATLCRYICLAYSPDNGRTLSLFPKLFFAITSIKWKKHGESTQLSGAEKGIRKYTTAFFAAATGPGFDQAPLFYVQLRKKIVLHNKCKQKRP